MATAAWTLAMDFADTQVTVATRRHEGGVDDEPVADTSPTAAFVTSAGELIVGARAEGREGCVLGAQRLLGDQPTLALAGVELAVSDVVAATLAPLLDAALERTRGDRLAEVLLTCPDSWPASRREALAQVCQGLVAGHRVRLVSRAVSALEVSMLDGAVAVVTIDRFTVEAAVASRLGGLLAVESFAEGAQGDLVPGILRWLDEVAADLSGCCLMAGPAAAAAVGELLARAISRPLVLAADAAALGAVRIGVAVPVQVIDDDVQFTVYRPVTVRPGRWYTVLAFAHKSEPFVDEERGPVDPLAEVRKQAEAALAQERGRYVSSAHDSSRSLVRDTELRFVPEVGGVVFNPPERVFRWVEPVHQEQFRVRADETLDGMRARGRMSVYLGCVLIGEVSLTFRVGLDEPETPAQTEERGRAYRNIFASYSHLDGAVVERLEAYDEARGDRYLRDARDLRAGEVWHDRLLELIREADVFQLFWSANAMRSEFVRHEWSFALGLQRPDFIRPVYWEEPRPTEPKELAHLHFGRLPLAPTAEPPPAAPQRQSRRFVTRLAPPAAGRARRTLLASGGGVATAAIALVAVIFGLSASHPKTTLLSAPSGAGASFPVGVAGGGGGSSRPAPASSPPVRHRSASGHARDGSPPDRGDPVSALERFWTDVGQGRYTSADARETRRARATGPALVSHWRATRPVIRLASIGRPRLLGARANIAIVLYVSGRGAAADCRRLAGIVRMTRAGGEWRYDGFTRAPRVAVAPAVSCHAS